MHPFPTPTFKPVLALLVAAALGCARQPVEHTARKVTPESVATTADRDGAQMEKAIPAAAESPRSSEAATVPGQDEAREQFKRKLVMKIDQFDVQLQELRIKAAKLEAGAKAEWDERIAALASQRDAVQARIDEAMKATNEGWSDLRDHAHNAWDELEKGVSKAAKEL